MEQIISIFQDQSILTTVTLCISAILIGINKTGIPGLGTLPVLLLTMCFPARTSTGLQLIMLCTADILAVSYYRKKADWKILIRLLPSALAGLLCGDLILRLMDDRIMKASIGVIILLMEALNFARKKYLSKDWTPSHFAYTAGFGILAGTTTQIANAAGPVAAIYLLSMRLPKEKYMGTCAWFFLIMNWIKLPVFITEGRITKQSFLIDLPMLPMLIFGAWLGILFVKKIPQNIFEIVIEVLIIVSALKLLISF